ncbi:MAG: hypothetical protein HY719_16690 [Planctomycetes bacterium]|nr:hypothetical protein [Planctomycetota bacterium]
MTRRGGRVGDVARGACRAGLGLALALGGCVAYEMPPRGAPQACVVSGDERMWLTAVDGVSLAGSQYAVYVRPGRREIGCAFEAREAAVPGHPLPVHQERVEFETLDGHEYLLMPVTRSAGGRRIAGFRPVVTSVRRSDAAGAGPEKPVSP